MVVKNKAQVSMEDRIISNSALLDVLEQRESLKEASDKAREAAKAFYDKDDEAKATIKALETEQPEEYCPPYRIGRFYVSKSQREGHHVEFDTENHSSLKIERTDTME